MYLAIYIAKYIYWLESRKETVKVSVGGLLEDHP